LILSFEFDTSIVVARQSFNPHLKNQEIQDAFNQTRERERIDGMDDVRW